MKLLNRTEDWLATVVLCAMALLPLVEILGRFVVSSTLPGSITYVEVMTLVIGFLGAMLAAREGRHLSLSTGVNLFKGLARSIAGSLSTAVAALVTFVLAYGAYLAVLVEMDSTEIMPGGIPEWVPMMVMPIGYALVAVRLVTFSFRSWGGRVAVFVMVALGLVAAYLIDAGLAERLLWPGVGVILIATVLGAPIYVALGGAALLLFWADGTPVASVAAETIRQIRAPMMPAIPLFTFAGYVLAEGGASKRLVRVFRAWFGWLPGGMAVMTALVCAFFTTFTGASGVTILALGGLLYPVLIKERYPEHFSVGLLTASGSIGLLFPPSLPVILYGVVAKVPIDQLFVAGVLPGVVLIAAVSLLGVRTGIKSHAGRAPFELREAKAAAWDAKWELFLPLIVVFGLFLGLTTLVESAALTAAYALLVEVVIYKDLSVRKDLVRVGKESAALVGGVLIILGVAMGFTSYLVDADVPAKGVEWVRSGIQSPYVFLLALNAFLLVVGCLMDIFSAIVVVVPLILPIGKHFGIDPLHLGVIFLANLELGFLTPPVGMNLFLASYRFKKPLATVYRDALPFLVILLLAVLLITYVPWMTRAPVEWIFGQLPAPPPIEF